MIENSLYGNGASNPDLQVGIEHQRFSNASLYFGWRVIMPCILSFHHNLFLENTFEHSQLCLAASQNWGSGLYDVMHCLLYSFLKSKILPQRKLIIHQNGNFDLEWGCPLFINMSHAFHDFFLCLLASISLRSVRNQHSMSHEANYFNV